MLNRLSFDKFKNELIKSLVPHSGFNSIQQTIDDINAVNFESENPKNSYKRVYDVLENVLQVAIPTNASAISNLSSWISPSPETKANQAIRKAKLSAQAYHTIAMLEQDFTQHDIPFHLADRLSFNNLNTNESTQVETKFKF